MGGSRTGGALALVEMALSSATQSAEPAQAGALKLVVALGFLNHDYALFRVPECVKGKRQDSTDESEQEAQDRCRVAYAQAAETSALEMTSGSGLLGTEAKLMLSMKQAHALNDNF